MQDYWLFVARPRRAARRPRRRQGVGALQARRRPLDRSAPRPAVAALHPRPELPGRRPGRSGDRRAGEGGDGSIRARSSCGSCSATCTARRARSAARFRSIRRCCSARASIASSTPTSCSASGLDYRRGGFVDRAVAAFSDVLKLDPQQRGRARQPREAAGRPAPVAGGVRHAQPPGADRRPAGSAEVAVDPRVPRERAGPAGAEGRPTWPKRRAGSRRRSSSTASVIPAYLHLGDVRAQQGDLPGAVAIWERSIDVVARSRLPGARSARARLRATRRATSGSPSCAASSSTASPREWRARAALARHLARTRPARAGARAALRGARAQPARARDPPGDLEHALGARPAAASGRALHRHHARVGLLPRPARVPAVPLPQHRAALAVPALPRVEHVRRRAHHAGDRHRSRDSRGLAQ